LVISVAGLVTRPGLVTLTSGARVADAVTAAGGAADGADIVTLNMARPVADGDQIVVGLAPVPSQPVGMASSIIAAGQSPSAGSAASGAAPPGRVNLNTATESELDELPGVGPVMAASIVRWRSEHGKFTSIDQLSEVDGIGPSRLDKLRALVVL
jgi:competence protein ComEA